MRLDPRRRRLLMIGAGGGLLALLFLLGRGGASTDAGTPAPVDPSTMATFAPPSDSGGGTDLSEVYSTIGQIQAGQQQLADAIVGGQQQLSSQIGGLSLGGAAAPADPPPATAASPVPRAAAHNAPAASSPAQRAPSQVHLRVADARDVGRVRRGTTNREIANRARAHPDWGPHTLAAGHQLRGHSVRF